MKMTLLLTALLFPALLMAQDGPGNSAVKKCVSQAERDYISFAQKKYNSDLIEIDSIKPVTTQHAIGLVMTEGFLEGKRAQEAISEINNNYGWIFEVVSSSEGGSQTDVLLTEKGSCKLLNVVTVQQE